MSDKIPEPPEWAREAVERSADAADRWAELAPEEKIAHRDETNAKRGERLLADAAAIQSTFAEAMAEADQYVEALRPARVEAALVRAVEQRDELRAQVSEHVEQLEAVRDEEYQRALMPVESSLDVAKASAIEARL